MKIIKIANNVKLSISIEDWIKIGKKANWLDSSFDKEAAKKKKNRCWDGYEPVPGKEPYSDGSCRKK